MKEFERRWVKPTVFFIVLIVIPLGLFGYEYLPTTIKAMNNYGASPSEAWTAARRNDKKNYFEHTPNKKDHPIIYTESELPENPVLIAFYLQHCPYCEEASPVIESYRQQILEKYPKQKEKVVYVDVKSPIGQKLIHKYDVMGASSLLLLAEDPDDNTLLLSGMNDAETGEPAPDKENIKSIFQKLDEELYKNHKHQEQRERKTTNQ